MRSLESPGVGPGALLQLAAVEGRVGAVEAPGLLRGARRGAHHVLRQLLEVSVLQPHGRVFMPRWRSATRAQASTRRGSPTSSACSWSPRRQVGHLASLVRQIDVVPEREFDVIELHTHYFRDPEL